MRTGVLAVVVATLCSVASSKIVVVTGATGHTGSQVYLALQAQKGVVVRGLVRNATKAKAILNCGTCSENEGIYEGDITKPETLARIMEEADTLVITTGPAYHCDHPSIYVGCHFYPGADPKTIAWEGVKNQVTSFASSPSLAMKDRHVILLSNDLTTQPDNFLDKIDNGHSCFYALNGEVFTMASGIPFTILKPNGLNEGEAGKQEILVAHDDQGWSSLNPNTEFIARSDVVRLLTYATLNPEKTKGLRFDVTSKRFLGTPTKDVATVFEAAKYPWDSRQPMEVVV